MKKFVLLVIALIVATQISLAQDEKHGMVHLKNGGSIRGTVIEKSAEQVVEVATPEGDVFIYRMNEISRIKYDRAGVAQKRFFSTVSINGGALPHDSDGYYGVHYVGSYRLSNRFSLGLGLGLGYSYLHRAGLGWWGITDDFESFLYIQGQYNMAQDSSISPKILFSAGIWAASLRSSCECGGLGSMSFNGRLAQLSSKVHLYAGIGCRVLILDNINNTVLPQISLGITF